MSSCCLPADFNLCDHCFRALTFLPGPDLHRTFKLNKTPLSLDREAEKQTVIHGRATCTLLPKFPSSAQDGCNLAEPFFFPAVVPRGELINSHSSGSLRSAQPQDPEVRC